MKKSVFIVFFIMLICVVALIFNIAKEKKIRVAVSTRIQASTQAGFSETEVYNFYLKTHPKSRIKLEFINDNWSPKEGYEVISKAIKTTPFIITAHPSIVSVATKDLFLDGRALCLVTSAVTDEISKIDDYIFRIVPDVHVEEQHIANKILSLPINRVFIIADDSHPPFINPALDTIVPLLEEGGKEVQVLRAGIENFDYSRTNNFLSEPYDLLYILVGSFQTGIGNIAQLSYLRNPDASIMLTPWARASNIIATAGNAVEKIILPSQYPSICEDEKLRAFFMEVKKEYNYVPTAMFISIYQSLELLDYAFEQGHTKPKEVKKFFLSEETMGTTFGSIRFDEYGDNHRDFYYLHSFGQEFLMED